MKNIISSLSDIKEALQLYRFGDNTGMDAAVALLVFFGLWIALKIFQLIIVAYLKKWARKTKTDFDDVLISIFADLKPPFYFLVALFFGIKVLSLPPVANELVKILFLVVIVYEVIKGLEKIMDYIIALYFKKANAAAREQSESMVTALRVIIKIILWVLGITVILSNMGVDVTSLIASLGIGGLAVALALQSILSDLFSSFSIYLDKPFQEGDVIKVGDDIGIVEKIGLKSTRVRDLKGEQLIISNKELTTARVRNYKRMERRRVISTIGVVYETPHEKLEKIPVYVKDIVESVEHAQFDRCHFKEYGDFSLIFEFVYYITTSDYAVYMDVQQKINLALFEKFEKEKIVFAYPTQTIFLEKP